MSPQEEVLADAGRRARSFGAVAATYDRIRPGYPAELVDDLLAYAAPVRRALEVGAGTGLATTAVASRGVPVRAVEPDPEMAALLVRRVAPWPEVVVTIGGFEQEPNDGPYDLIFCAQAWHWVDPHLRWQRAASLLRPGGGLGLFWNRDRCVDAELEARMQQAHDRFTPGIQIVDAEPDEPATAWPARHLATLPEFGDLDYRGYTWQRTMRGADYVELLSTVSAYNVRPAQAREALFADLLEIIGDELVLDMTTGLYLARRT